MTLTCHQCASQKDINPAPKRAGRSMDAYCSQCRTVTKHFIGTPARPTQPATLTMR